MKNQTLALPIGLVLAALTACMAVERGQQSDFPVEQPSMLSETTVLPGQTVYVSYSYPRAMFEADNEFEARFDALAFDYSGVRTSDDRVPNVYAAAPWFMLRAVEAPTGVSVALVKANLARVVTQTRVVGDSVNVKYRDEFKLLYRVSVSPDFDPPALTAAQEGVNAATEPATKASPSPTTSVIKTLLEKYAGDLGGLSANRARLTFSDGSRTSTASLFLKYRK
ncbi:hypothetical protein [Deinococcus koreensis]|uniref:DUF4136 domain-containing protein n=1 Tax=Deinococcus koreensis TaxID=2054903 RepID=A0A2K3V1Q5_9DEIO|nr:hypothetical protein [Deinococcus koreensis]PNY82716.1 hypothetical protein CVO96_16360 [Deinococcus koreensis]